MLTIVYPTAVGPIGPGYFVTLQESAGPVPLDDFGVLLVQDTATDLVLCGYSRVCRGFLSVDGLMGLRERDYPSVTVAYNATRRMGGAFGIATPGLAVTVSGFWLHADGTVVDNVSVPGWTWDPVGALGEYNLALTAGTTGGSGDLLQAIYDAVHTVFPRTA